MFPSSDYGVSCSHHLNLQKHREFHSSCNVQSMHCTSLWLIVLQQMRWPWNTAQLRAWLLISLLKHYRVPPSRSLETKLWMLIQLSQAYWIPWVCWRIWMLTYTPRTVYGFGTPAKKKKGMYQWWRHHDDSIAGIHMLLAWVDCCLIRLTRLS